MIDVARETLVLRRGDSPFIVTYTYICFSIRSKGYPLFYAEWNAPYRYYNIIPAPSASALYPIIIHARTLD